jgi:DNA-binding SARP family transcriptional activator
MRSLVTESTSTCPTPSRISLSLIRDFEVRHNGELVDLPPNSQRLVGFLAFQDRPVRRSYVSGTLWFNADDYRASASLRSALWRLPSMPGFDLVGSSHTHIWLRPSVTIDIREMMERGMRVLSAPHGDSELIDVARELVSFGDDVLVGWYDDWVITEREQFRQIRLHALDRIGDQLLDQGRFCDALQVGLAAIRAEPLRESSHRLLIRVHLREGNVAEAIRQYRSYAGLLRRELQATPSPVMQGLLTPHLIRA